MNRTLTVALAGLLAVVLLTTAVVPAAATGSVQSTPDECMNSDAGPTGDDGPPGFVGGLVPDFIGDLIGSLPVPGFVKGLFGASGC